MKKIDLVYSSLVDCEKEKIQSRQISIYNRFRLKK